MISPANTRRRIPALKKFGSVTEKEPFFKLWPHRFDYIYATHPDPGTRPEWLTESAHPLSDRLIEQGSYLYGVRFGKNTNYGLLDIDKGSPYHPRRDPQCLNRIFEALEPLGLVEYLIITSSDSGGLHIYLPFELALPSWKLADGICALLEKAGFKIMPGWLEVFPNRKPFSTDGSISLYNGHRLPMQQGSYILNQALQPIASNEQTFTHRWKAATQRNDICEQTLTRIVKQYQRRQYRITGKAEKFLNDLNAVIERGWTDKGQTNHLVGRIAMRSYIFGHVIGAPAPLTGQMLIDDVVRVAKGLPGYNDYCGHQHEIKKRAREWCASAEKSNYFHYGLGTIQRSEVSWNEQQRLAARDRIREVVIELIKSNIWPEGVSARIDAIQGVKGISGTTLYKNKDLWHPVYLKAAIRNAENASNLQPLEKPVENPPDPPFSSRGAEEVRTLPPCPPNLLGGIGCNSRNGKDRSAQNTGNHQPSGGGVRNEAIRSKREADSQDERRKAASAITADMGEHSPCPQQLSLDIRAMLERTKLANALQTEHEQEQYRHQRRQEARAAYRAKLEAQLHSGDRVLETEARRQLERLRSVEREDEKRFP